MQFEEVKQILLLANINFDFQCIQDVYNFLLDHIGQVNHEKQKYHCLAAAAIVSQLRQVPNVAQSGTTRMGICIENIMRHIGGLSKEEFLEVVTTQCNKWIATPHWLKTKVNRVKIAYRIFKKYRKTYERLAQTINLAHDIYNDLESIFWILYLYVKYQNVESDNVRESARILNILFISIFSHWISHITSQQVNKIVAQDFPERGNIDQPTFIYYYGLFMQKLAIISKLRYDSGEINWKKFLVNCHLIKRMQDDMSNHFEKYKSEVSAEFIDEITFLQLDKTLTPLTFRKVPENVQPISRFINFGSEDLDSTIESVDKKKQNQQSYFRMNKPSTPVYAQKPKIPLKLSVGQATPVSKTIINLNWVNSCLDHITEQDRNRVRATYEQYHHKSYDQYQREVLEKIIHIIIEFSPNCRDHTERKQKLYNFFLFFICKIIDKHSQEDNFLIFSQIHTFDAVLCLSTELFNFAYQSLTGQYKKYCQIFQVDLLSAFKPLNWIGINLSLPKDLRNYLYNLEKKILIQDIWQDSTGYNIVNPLENSLKYSDMAILKRLNRHIQGRIQQLCFQLKLGDKIVRRSVNLVEQIIKHRCYLLEHNKIDQIIICSITSCLSLNEQRMSIEKIFNAYNQIHMSFHSNKDGLHDQKGHVINLLDYYNNVFMVEMEQMAAEDKLNEDIMGTPLRNQRYHKAKFGYNMTPLPTKFPQTSINMFNPQPFKKTKKDELSSNSLAETYRKKLANNLRCESNNSFNNLQLLQNNEEQEIQSREQGNLPNIYRNHSFGNQ